MSTTIYDVLEELRTPAVSEADKGSKFGGRQSGEGRHRAGRPVAMGVMWHFIVDPPDGEPTSPSGPGEDPDEAVRPGLPPEQHPGSVRPKMARRCADDLTPSEAGTRTAAPSTPSRHLRELASQRLPGSQK